MHTLLHVRVSRSRCQKQPPCTCVQLILLVPLDRIHLTVVRCLVLLVKLCLVVFDTLLVTAILSHCFRLVSKQLVEPTHHRNNIGASAIIVLGYLQAKLNGVRTLERCVAQPRNIATPRQETSNRRKY